MLSNHGSSPPAYRTTTAATTSSSVYIPLPFHTTYHHLSSSMMEDPGAHVGPRSVPPNGREDCWSNGATQTLIDAWGDRYLHLSRGNLRQNDWTDVADAVNRRQSAVNKPRKTDAQCKNRIDTLKKKYKLERSKPGSSKWPFFACLQHLIGSTAKSDPSNATPMIKSFTVKSPNLNPNSNSLHHHIPSVSAYSGGSTSNSSGSTESSRDGGGNVEAGFEDSSVGKHQKRDQDLAFRELARVVMKFGEIYERIENTKQHQMMELERQRMEFTKEMEFQRMQMFMEAQLELEKMKRPKYNSGSGKKP